MKTWTRGFTLIELLVVVLIIGILAAIAVPQYQKAVLKSRFSSLMPTTQAIRDGNEMYYMTNGRYADAVSKLDVTAANTEDMTITLSDDSDYAYTLATRPSLKNNLIVYQKHSENFPNEIHCEALADDDTAEYVCRSAGATRDIGTVLTEGYTTYIISGNGAGLAPGADDDEVNENGGVVVSCESAEALGLTCNITTNDDGQTVKQVCQNGFCRTNTYNEDGSYTSVTCQANSENVCTSNWRSATYDANGNQLTARYCSSVDNSGNCTAYSYGYNHTYDANGNMLTSRSCSSFDSSGNCTAYSGGAGSYNYTYDANGNKLTYRECSSVDTSGNCTAYNARSYDYTYDANGNMLTQRQCGSVDSSGNCTAYAGYDNSDSTYDANGNKLTERYCSGSNIDSSGNCTAYNGGLAYTYDANGNKLTTRNCDSLDSSGNCTAYAGYNNYDSTYDANGKLLTSRQCSSVGSSGNCTAYSLISDYTYDANGNLTRLYCNGSNVDRSSWNCTAYSGGYKYTYDANGNKLTERSCSSVDSSGNCTAYASGNYSGNYNYTYDANGKLLMQRTCSSVDSSGNCTAYGGTSYVYTYDDNGKKIAYQTCSGSNVNTATGECIAYNSTSVYNN